jgi:hypothetical protein
LFAVALSLFIEQLTKGGKDKIGCVPLLLQDITNDVCVCWQLWLAALPSRQGTLRGVCFLVAHCSLQVKPGGVYHLKKTYPLKVVKAVEW